jgi:hypothetical protein
MKLPFRFCSTVFLLTYFTSVCAPGFAQALPDTSMKELPNSLEEQLLLFSLKQKAPIVDGVLDDKCWQGAQKATGFMPTGKAEKAGVETEVMSCYDDGVLYFGVKAFEPQMAQVKVVPDRVWNGDSVEFFFDPQNAKQKYLQVIVDSEANIFTAWQGDGTGQVKLPITAKAKKFADYWTVEVAIPFAALGVTLPADNARWGFNIGRERYAGGAGEVFSWSPLGAFAQRDKWGQISFFSKADVDADLAYWRKYQADPLLRRAVVSAFDLVQQFAGVKKLPTLWNYDPYAAERQKHAKWEAFGLQGGGVTGYKDPKTEYPEFYRAAMGLNRALIAKTYLDEQMRQLQKSAFYLAKWRSVSLPGSKAIVSQSAAIDAALNNIYQQYGRAFDDNWNKTKLGDIDAKITKVHDEIGVLRRAVAAQIVARQNEVRKSVRWKSESLRLSPKDKLLNADGTTRRFSYDGMRFDGHEEVFDLLGVNWDSINIDWQYVTPEMNAPGSYNYKSLDEYTANILKYRKAPKVNFQTLFGSQYWMPLAPWMEEKAAKEDDIYLTSQDGLTPTKMMISGKPIHQGMNPNNAEVQQFELDYLKSLAAHTKDTAHFYVTGWEDYPIIQPLNAAGETPRRSPGYDVSNKASFRKYLQERYKTIGKLNTKWQSAYTSFEAIEPPTDKYIEPAKAASGLTYEFERWIRVNHINYNVSQRVALKAGAPNVPVMIDDSNFLIDMNGYLMYRAGAADIYSHHSTPDKERMMWAYLSSMRRRFGKALGYHENYWEMYRNNHLSDERLAKNDVRQFFFNLYGRDINYSTWWLRTSTATTDYVVAYGGGVFGLDYDQTIYRWSTTELAPMFERGRQIEKALVESKPETPTVAVIQPCATLFNYAAMGKTYRDSPPVLEMLEAYNTLLEPNNIAHDYLPEEMVLDGVAKLDEYKVLVLPHALYMNEEFARRLKDWVTRGGVLLAMSDLPQRNEFGQQLPEQSSLIASIPAQIRDEKVSSAPVGKGRVLLLNGRLSQVLHDETMSASLRNELRRAAPPSATSPDTDLQIWVRVLGKQKYLLLNNRNVEKPLQTTVNVNGKFASALDVTVPDWFPVPSKTVGNSTTLQISLPAGEWTMLRLQ